MSFPYIIIPSKLALNKTFRKHITYLYKQKLPRNQHNTILNFHFCKKLMCSLKLWPVPTQLKFILRNLLRIFLGAFHMSTFDIFVSIFYPFHFTIVMPDYDIDTLKWNYIDIKSNPQYLCTLKLGSFVPQSFLGYTIRTTIIDYYLIKPSTMHCMVKYVTCKANSATLQNQNIFWLFFVILVTSSNYTKRT